MILGTALAVLHGYINHRNSGFQLTLVLMPLISQCVIMMVNGNVGTGIAVAGAFGLVRFRSMQYKAEDIMLLFAAMTIGLADSVGYVGFSALFAFAVCVIMIVFNIMNGSFTKSHQLLKITCPESLDYESEFSDLFEKYTLSHQLLSAKTTNLGSLNKLSYDVVLKEPDKLQKFINELRIRNGNLEIYFGTLPEVNE